jgi:hypothetical protein
VTETIYSLAGLLILVGVTASLWGLRRDRPQSLRLAVQLSGLLIAVFLLAAPLPRQLAGFFPSLFGAFAPVLVVLLATSAVLVGLSIVQALVGNARRAIGAMLAAIICLVLAWALSFACYFGAEDRHGAKPRRGVSSDVIKLPRAKNLARRRDCITATIGWPIFTSGTVLA